MPLKAVGLAEIERVFEVLERLQISREAVVIPLKPAHPGTIRLLDEGKNKGKLEIVVESETSLDEWLPWVESEIRRLMARD